MKLRSKRSIVLMLVLAMVISLMPGMGRRAYASGMSLVVGGVWITDYPDMTVNGTGGGTAKLTLDDSGNPVLTLTDYVYEGPGCGYGAIEYDTSSQIPLTIVLEGTNRITHTFDNQSHFTETCGISANGSNGGGPITITGNGTLYATGGRIEHYNELQTYKSVGISNYEGDIIIESGTIYATGGVVSVESGHEAVSSGLMTHGSVIIKGGDVHATGDTVSLAASSRGKSAGIDSENTTIEGGIFYASGGTATCADQGSIYFSSYGADGDVTIKSGMIYAEMKGGNRSC